MLHLNVLVPQGHDRTAVMILSDGLTRVREEAGVASSSQAIAASHGNPACDPLRPFGHPPFGSYLLLRRANAPAGCEDEYGSDILLFEARDGVALEAESFGRIALLVYAGPVGHDARMRRTNGGVRLSQAMMDDITTRLGARDMGLRIGPLDSPAAWWQFWKPRYGVRPVPLSSDTPRLFAPPLDEASLVFALLQGTQKHRRQQVERDDDWDRPRRGESSSGGSSEPFAGRGGTYGGAGASGSWGDAPADAGRAGTVDASGRIVAAAAGMAAAAQVFSRDGEAAEGGDTHTRSESTDGDAAEGGDAGTRSETSY
jgi:hypothetical protein